MQVDKRINIKRIKLKLTIIFSIFMIFSGISFSAGDISAEFVGRTIFTAQQVNEQGLFMEIQLNGGSFKSEISDEDKEKLISSLFIDLDEGHILDGKKGNLEILRYIQKERANVLVQVGQDAYGKPMNSIDRFLEFETRIPQEIRDNGDVFIDEKGHLIIQCDSQYFKELKNNIIYTNGGVPVGYGDLPIYVNIPETMIEGSDEDSEEMIQVNGYYCIVEMKARVEIYAYDDEDARNNKDIQRVHQIEHITEQDIRAGGKLLKFTIDSRNGPTNWAISTKHNPKFVYNSFRTERDYIEGGASNPEFNKILSELGSNLEEGNAALANWNGYWMSDIKRMSNEATVEDMGPMYYFVEFPVVKDFNIDGDLVVYMNVLAGMGGGTGKSGPEGEPFWGMDGRLSFTILSGDDSDITEQKQDDAGNDEGFGAGSGSGFGNEAGTGDGSDQHNRPGNTTTPTQTTAPSPTPQTRVQRVEVTDRNNQRTPTQTTTPPKTTPEAEKEPEEEPEPQENREDLSQGSAGEGISETAAPKKVYDVSDQFVDETRIKKVDYDLEKYFAGLVLVMMLGAAVRYITYSKYIY